MKIFDNKKFETAEEYRMYASAHKKAMKDNWMTFLKTGVFVLVSLIVLVFIALAWFAMNDRVNGDSSTISTTTDLIRIASKGNRQSAESRFFNLTNGQSFTYKEETYYYTDGGEIALRCDNDYEICPGSSGKIEFFVVPQKDGADKVDFYINLLPYKEVQNGNVVEVEKVSDEILNTLFKGHLLLFREFENGVYSDRIQGTSDLSHFTLKMDERTKANVPIACTIYWIWPKTYENMIGMSGMQNYVNEQALDISKKTVSGTSYYYSEIFISEQFPLSTNILRTKGYNLADEYIGMNMNYVYFSVSTSPFE